MVDDIITTNEQSVHLVKATVRVKELAANEALAAPDTLLTATPKTLGVDHNAHVIESVLKCVASEFGWL